MVSAHTVGKYMILSIVITGIAQYILKVINVSNFFGAVHNHSPGPCHLLEDVVHGSEDIQMLPNGKGKALITSGLHLKVILGVSDTTFMKRKGQILLFDFNNPKQNPIPLKITGTLDMATFHPHGISIWSDDESGKVFVYVVSHVNGTHDHVEKFIYNEECKELKHVKSITDPNFQVLNDIVAFGEDQFYATNFFVFRSPYTFLVEQNTFSSWGSVVYYNGNCKDSKLVAHELSFPNGINMSPDRRYLYVANFLMKQLLTYKITTNNELEKVQAFEVHTLLDNLDVDPSNGDIWTGAHPLGFKLESYLDNPDVYLAPSQVLRISVKDGLPVSMTEPYADDGNVLQASSVAVKYKQGMLVGTVHSGLLYCDIKYI